MSRPAVRREGDDVNRMIHIGRKVPKGFIELPGAIHVGKGIWILPMRPKTQEEKDASAKKARTKLT